jgi:hypothetical protein
MAFRMRWRFASQNRLMRADTCRQPRTRGRALGGREPLRRSEAGEQMSLGCMRMLVCLAGVAFASPSFAHHSFAMFDKNRNVELVGVVTRFEWTNPHSYIVVSVTENGRQQEYTIETGAPGSLIRLDERWRSDIVKPGDRVKLVINPLKSGQPGGALVDLITPDGRVLGQHAPKPNVPPLKGH